MAAVTHKVVTVMIKAVAISPKNTLVGYLMKSSLIRAIPTPPTMLCITPSVATYILKWQKVCPIPAGHE